MTFKKFIIQILVVAFSIGNHQIQASDFGLEYNSEWQTNFENDYKWVNLLKLNASLPVSNSLSFEACTISIANTDESPLIDDLQGYSNIDEGNLPLIFAVLGAEFRYRKSQFFIGIRNVNEDYFTTPITSFFTNSSCGIFPPIAGNYDIANYPLSSWCLHYSADFDCLVLNASIYEGRGHKAIAGHDNIFSFSPADNGFFSITSAEYKRNDSNYNLGCAVYYGVHSFDEDGGEAETASQPSPQSSKASKKVSVAPWINVEQKICHNLNLLLQGSFCSSDQFCRYYFGAGATLDYNKIRFGLFADTAVYNHANESVIELTCQIPLSKTLIMQPTLDVIRTESKTKPIGLLRLTLSL